MKRAIINVAAGSWYPRGQERLLNSLSQHGHSSIASLMWRDNYPAGSPTHQQKPFAFKSHAFAAAAGAGYKTLLWVDASVWAVAPIEPLFKEIEERGYLFFNNGFRIGQWTSDYCLNVFGKTRDWAMERWDMTAQVMGLNLDHQPAKAWLDEFCELCLDDNLMHGSLHSKPGEDVTDPHSNRNVGVISADPRCRGHAREQAVATMLAYKHGLDDFTLPPKWLHLTPPSVKPDSRAVFQACGL